MMKQNSSIYYIKASSETLILSERNSQAAKPLIFWIIGQLINPCKAKQRYCRQQMCPVGWKRREEGIWNGFHSLSWSWLHAQVLHMVSFLISFLTFPMSLPRGQIATIAQGRQIWVMWNNCVSNYTQNCESVTTKMFLKHLHTHLYSKACHLCLREKRRQNPHLGERKETT